MISKIRDLKGQKFGRLTVISLTEKRNFYHVVWLCRCDCGNFREVVGNNLKSGQTKSCGCLHAEKNKTHAVKYGLSRTKLYSVWLGMKARCYYLRNKAYKYYGGRGIKVCRKWREDFISFRSFALTNGWREGLVIDRIDNDGNYEPSNIQFITKSEHAIKGNKARRRNNYGIFIGGMET